MVAFFSFFNTIIYILRGFCGKTRDKRLPLFLKIRQNNAALPRKIRFLSAAFLRAFSGGFFRFFGAAFQTFFTSFFRWILLCFEAAFRAVFAPFLPLAAAPRDGSAIEKNAILWYNLIKYSVLKKDGFFCFWRQNFGKFEKIFWQN
jgi:hypothetical protein